MAYKLERAKRIVKEFELAGEVITINLSADDIIKEFTKTQNDIIRADIELKKAQAEGVSVENMNQRVAMYGEAIIAMFRLIFGEETTEKILNFYENNYSEVIDMVFPFIQDEIIPEINALVEDRRKKNKHRYLNRQQRRFASKNGKRK